MKNDKAWIKDVINEEGIVMNRNSLSRHDEQYWKNENIKINKGRLFYLIDQLVDSEVKQLNKKIKELESYNDKLIRDNNQLRNELDNQEVLSQAWIDEYAQGDCDEWVYTEDLQNLLVPKQNKPVIPQFVADYIEKYKEKEFSLKAWFNFANNEFERKAEEWLSGNSQEEMLKRQYLFIDAIRYGYKVEKEPIYFAKIKGHELVQTETVLDDDTGDDISEFCRNVYFVLQRNGELVIDMKNSGLSGAKNIMTMSQWNDLGVNETNADFEEVIK